MLANVGKNVQTKKFLVQKLNEPAVETYFLLERPSGAEKIHCFLTCNPAAQKTGHRFLTCNPAAQKTGHRFLTCNPAAQKTAIVS